VPSNLAGRWIIGKLSRIAAALDKARLCRSVLRPIFDPAEARPPSSAGGLSLVDDEGPPPRRGALIGLIVAAVLAAAAVYLVHALREESQREDCLMSGRSNCAPIETPGNSR
jgi:hypothetical protein